MNVKGQHFRTIWLKPGQSEIVQIIDQRTLPHQFVIENITTVAQMCVAIKDMHVRGAGLIGAAAGYGMYLAVKESIQSGNFDESIDLMAQQLKATRPTAVNLEWAVDRQLNAIADLDDLDAKLDAARIMANQIADVFLFI